MKEKQNGGAESKAMTSKHHINKKGPKCFHCVKFGHLKRTEESVNRDYPKKKAFLTKKTKWSLVVLKTNMLLDCLLTMH